jgi:MscS family membrane protein
VFPQRSQKAAQQLYNDLYPWGIDKLLSLLPDTFRYTGKVLGFSLWNVCALLIVLALVICIHKVLSLLLTVVVQFMLQYLHFGRYAGKVIAPVARPLSIVLVLHLALTLVPAIELAPDLTRWLLYAFDIIIPVFFTVILYRIAGIVSEFLKARAQKTEGTLDDQLVPVITNLLRTLVVITGVIMVFYNLKVDLTALIAGLSIGGLALALAAQDTVKNFFGSLVIFLDKPFQVGQLIKTGEVEGVVESVGIRATRVRTLHNSLVYVPNAVLADRAIDNLGMRNYRRMLITISIQYDTPPDLIEAYTEALNTLVHTHPSANKDLSQVHLNALGASSIDIRFCAFFDLPTFSEELLARQEMLLAIIRIAHQLGIQFAFPTQTVHIENLPGQPSLSAEYTLNAQTAREVAQKALAAEAATWRKPPTQP